LGSEGVNQANVPRRYAVAFCVDGDIKYLSHHDTVRVMARGLTRAQLPVRYTQGFNPHPRIALPLPRPVGLASEAERLVVEFTEAVDPAKLVESLQSQMPAGIRIRGARRLASGERNLPTRVTYRVDVHDAGVSGMPEAARKLLALPSVHVERHTGGMSPAKRVDLRPYIETIEVTAETVTLVLRVTGQGTARPAEVCRLLGIHDDAIHRRIRRTEVVWQ
jgi:radical SAM-linked protein